MITLHVLIIVKETILMAVSQSLFRLDQTQSNERLELPKFLLPDTFTG